MQKVKITAVYNGEEFELIYGEKYEFSNDKNFECFKRSILEYFTFNEIRCFAGNQYKYIRPIQKPVARPLTHKEIAMNIVGKGVTRCKNSNERPILWRASWGSGTNISIYEFCFFSDLDTDHEVWHNLTTDLLEIIKEREI